MAFCNSCGNAIESGASFCPKCGAAASASLNPTTAPPTAVPVAKSSTLSTVLIILGVLFALLIAGMVASLVVARRIVRRTHIEKNGDNVRVETPFGTVESSTDTDTVVRDLGPAVYPGARIDKGTASRADIAGTHTISAQFDVDEPASKVVAYYKKLYPDANVSVVGDDHTTIVSTANRSVVTVNIEADNGQTQVHIASVNGSSVSGGHSSN